MEYPLVNHFTILKFIEHLKPLEVPLDLELQIGVMMVLDRVKLARLVKKEVKGFLDHYDSQHKIQED